MAGEGFQCLLSGHIKYAMLLSLIIFLLQGGHAGRTSDIQRLCSLLHCMSDLDHTSQGFAMLLCLEWKAGVPFF